ncbi:MAG: alpha/beta fold hydrolase [Dehalococcoidales bacterium]|nr:alpha/beta fold hydrolase [Dehalococcoidales bacterium]
MSTYILIHGAWHGAWCWYKVIPHLEKAGHTVLAPDMPGYGVDKTPVKDVTFKKIVEKVCGILDAQQEPVILVGHSWGGSVITQAAEYRPDRIKTLVYLAAFLSPTSNYPPVRIGDSKLSQCVIPSEDGSYSTLKTDTLKEALYHDCPDEDIALARLCIGPHPTASNSAVKTTEQNYEKVPRIYIECLQDQAILHSVQKEMYTRHPCRKVITMDTSHMPMFSAPEELAGHLLSIE